MSQTICMILDSYYPSDIRVFKESYSLISAGFEVHLVCLQGKGQKPEENLDGLMIHRLNGPKTVVQKGIQDVLDVLRGYFNPLFYKALIKLHRKYNFDYVHVHDLPLANTALKLKRRDPKLKVFLDLHENYPEAFKVWFTWRKNPIIRLKNRIFFSFERWSKYEKEACSASDKVIAVVDEMKNKLLSKDQELDIHVITNTEQLTFLDQKLYEDIYGEFKNKFIVTYTGNVGPHRGVDTAIKGMAHLTDIDDVVLFIVGGARPYMTQTMNSLISELELKDKVKILGYQPFEKFFSFMKLASVNLIPHNKNGHTDNTVPHKLFQSMMVGKPVLVSSVDPLKRIVESLEAGLVFEAENSLDFSEKVRILYNDKVLSGKLGQNGYTSTVQGLYNWETTGEKLVSMYRNGE